MIGGPVLWRAAWAVGSCSEDDSIVLDGILPALSGRRDWASPAIDLVGLLVGPARMLGNALGWAAVAAPSLQLQLHYAETWGHRDCEATLLVAEGTVTLESPGVPHLRGMSLDEEYDWVLETFQILHGGRPNLDS